MTDESNSIFRRESLERLSSPEQLDQLMQVVDSKSWIPLTAVASLVFFALIWSIFGRIPITATGTGVLVRPDDSPDKLTGLIFFNPEDGNRIQPGMEIILVPDSTSSDRMGGILARVTSVSKPSITTLNAARQAATSSDIDAIAAEPIEVLAELERDPSTSNGYTWSSGGAGQPTLTPGITTTARITLDERTPISFVFPFLEVSQ